MIQKKLNNEICIRKSRNNYANRKDPKSHVFICNKTITKVAMKIGCKKQSFQKGHTTAITELPLKGVIEEENKQRKCRN